MHSIAVTQDAAQTSIAAVVEWEEQARPPFRLHFTSIGLSHPQAEIPGNSLLAATFPLALHDNERRLRIETPACPLLMDGLMTLHAWWSAWGFPRAPAPRIEARPSSAHWARPQDSAAALLSGGIDSFHMLYRNHRLHPAGSKRRIAEAVLVHGFDFGRRQRDAQDGLFEEARRRLARVAEDEGVRLGVCRTNIRHIATTPGFWLARYFGVAGAAVAHAAVAGPAFFSIAGSNDVANLSPLGSHPAVDPLLSSEHLTILHEGVRFSRLQKVRDLLGWKGALDALRVCAVPGRERLNCGVCSKCLRTRLELLVCGCEETEAFGRTAFSPELLDAVEVESAYDAACYAEILAGLPAGAHPGLSARLADLLRRHRETPSLRHVV